MSLTAFTIFADEVFQFSYYMESSAVKLNGNKLEKTSYISETRYYSKNEENINKFHDLQAVRAAITKNHRISNVKKTKTENLSENIVNKLDDSSVIQTNVKKDGEVYKCRFNRTNDGWRAEE